MLTPYSMSTHSLIEGTLYSMDPRTRDLGTRGPKLACTVCMYSSLEPR